MHGKNLMMLVALVLGSVWLAPNGPVVRNLMMMWTRVVQP